MTLDWGSDLVCTDQSDCVESTGWSQSGPGLSWSMQITQARPSLLRSQETCGSLCITHSLLIWDLISPPSFYWHHNTLQRAFELLVSRVRFLMGSLESNKTMHLSDEVRILKTHTNASQTLESCWSVMITQSMTWAWLHLDPWQPHAGTHYTLISHVSKLGHTTHSHLSCVIGKWFDKHCCIFTTYIKDATTTRMAIAVHWYWGLGRGKLSCSYENSTRLDCLLSGYRELLHLNMSFRCTTLNQYRSLKLFIYFLSISFIYDSFFTHYIDDFRKLLCGS